jgi:hypothetical protein
MQLPDGMVVEKDITLTVVVAVVLQIFVFFQFHTHLTLDGTVLLL